MKYLSWNDAFLLACSYYKKNGNLIVVNNYITESGYNLGNWIYNQRRFYKRNNLSQEKIDMLNSIGMIWDTFENNWKIMYSQAAKVFNDYGHIDIYNIDEKLSIWLKKQEKLYNNNELEKWKRELLENIYINENYLCKSNIKKTWENIYELAVKFYEDNHNLIIPRSYQIVVDEKVINLGKWINTQRYNYHEGKLEQEKIDLLNKIEMVWVVRVKQNPLEWDKWYKYASKFYERYNHLKVPTNYKVDDNYNLNNWLRRQKQLRNEGKLSTEKIQKLECIGIDWTIKNSNKIKYSWDEIYCSAVTYYKEHGDLFISSNYIDSLGYPLGKWIKKQRKDKKVGLLTIEQIEKLNNIGMIWYSCNTLTKISWEKAYEYAKEYYLEYGDLLVKRNYITKDGYKLGRWINTQRTYKVKGALSNEKIKLLDSIGMVWIINPDQERIEWLVSFDCAKKYLEKNHNLNIDLLFKTDDTYPKANYCLGRWLSYQKFLYHHKQLSKDKVEKLNDLNIDWRLNNKLSWDLTYQIAKQYYEEHGNLTSSYDYKTDNSYYVEGFNLYDWLVRQRVKLNNGTLSKKRIDKLNEIGMIWNLNDKNWNEMYKYLKLILIDEKSVDLNTLKKIKRWLSTQKHLYVTGELDSDRTNKLFQLGINLEILEKKTWNDSYEYAKKYYEKYGNISISTSYICEDGYRLGQWINNVKNAYRSGKLEQEKIELLEKLDIVWDRNPSEWDIYFDKAKNYYKEYGDLNIEKSYVTEDGYKLGQWLYRQKLNRNSNFLSNEKINRLESIGIEWSESKYLSWQESYLLAKKYYEEHGNLRITEEEYEGYTLSKWIRVQRGYYKKGILSDDKIALLNNIGMIWDLGLNKNNIKELCDEFKINYYLNKKELKYITYKELYAKLKFFKDNNISYLDNDNMLTSNVFLSSISFEEQYGISLKELMKTNDYTKVLKKY